MLIGILALQGDFLEHSKAIEAAGAESIEVKLPADLEKIDALAMPGGESTTISKLLAEYRLDGAIKKMVKKGMPVFATCAGTILLAKKILNEKKVKPLGLLDISISRNSYGRQIDSFEAPIELKFSGKPFNAVFIRSPIIRSAGKKVEVLAEYRGNPVLVRQGSILAATFHPELTDDSSIYKLFLKIVAEK